MRTLLPLRHDALDELTPDAAYWCGFLFTDGSIAQRPGRTPTVAVGISERDREHLEKLRAFLGSAHAITAVGARPVNGYISAPSVRFAVSSRRLTQRLLELGRYDGPLDGALAQSRDFWRGVIDGDGHVGIHKGAAQVRLVGSFWLLTAFADFVTAANGAPLRRPLTVRPHRSIYCVSTGWSTAERVADLLYRNAATALDRKAAAAVQIRELRAAAIESGTHPEVRNGECRYGHKYTEANTYLRQGVRHCRACNARRTREYYERKRG